MRPTYISWAPYCSRSDNTARELGGRSHMVYRSSLGSNVLTIWLKYLAQAIDTWRILSNERPDVVFVMSPPPVAVMVAWLYSRLHGVPYVVDAHTAAFLHPRWKYFQWLHNALCRSAITTIVTNDHLADRVRKAGAHATIIRDVPIEYKNVEVFERVSAFCVAVVCSFNYDEPIDEIISAAARLPDVHFYVTGNPERLDRERRSRLPSNVTLTGFLAEDAYGGLLTKSDVVITLTTRNHTMLRGAYEAVYQGTPVIVSDWPLLREAFNRGAIHVDNTASGIVAAVHQMRARHPNYRQEVLMLRDEKQSAWLSTKAALLERLGGRNCAG